MSDEVARVDNTIAQYERPAESPVERWARDAHQIAQVAVNLAKTAFVPASFNRDPAAATAAILVGQELGLPPMAALRSIDIVQGTPAMRAVLLRALVQSEGHDIWVEESNSTRAVVKGRRKGGDKVEESVWTTDRARQQNLLGKDNWKRMPQDMLLARATSAVARLIAADKILAIPYSTEELQDGVQAEPTGEQQVEAPRRRTAKRAALPAAVEPGLPAGDEPVQVEEPPVVAQHSEEPSLPVGVPFEGDPVGLTAEEQAELDAAEGRGQETK